MKAYQIKANEEFFDNLLAVLREGGNWVFPAAGVIFTARGGKLLGDAAGLASVKNIVSEKYFNKNFGILKD